MLKGSPLDQWKQAERLPPPAIALPTGPIPGPKRLPRPTGRSTTQLELNWCLVSKSETARSWLGAQELMTWLANPPTLPPLVSTKLMRSAFDPTSMDFENV